MTMKKSFPKYKKPSSIPIVNRQWPANELTVAPKWCSVDLRDGNQSLPIPMGPAIKLDYFNLLVDIGFKEIEVGFPSASQDDFDFCRKLIEENLIPEDVTISVLVQARKHLIDRTVEALKGVKKGIIHCYVATSDLHGKFVFGRERDEVIKMAVEGTQLVVDALERENMRDVINYEFSPEEFTDTDIDFAIELSKKVKEVWGECKKDEFILNLPATVERRPPNQYADMIEYFCRNYPYLDQTTISVHAHNDQGCAVAASELSLLAGAERVEGTLFGHGERTGNVDIVTLAMNMFSRGIDPKLDFSNIDNVIKIVEEASNIMVHPRHPYAGSLVYTAFSGSHQDAIRKGMELREEISEFFEQNWKVPYLHIDPADVGRKYGKLIRINAQSGKGGVVYILENDFDIYPPKKMHPAIGGVVQKVAEEKNNELSTQDIYDAFETEFVDVAGDYQLLEYKRMPEEEADIVKVSLKMAIKGEKFDVVGNGNGPVSAMVAAIKTLDFIKSFVLVDFSEQTLGTDANAVAMAYMGVEVDGVLHYGAGRHENIDKAAVRALFSALNRIEK
ncbi:2-isopropylmalate synthase [Lentisphaerota bacterium WC36G]|nr:2-isopropylmalate synthase [Lentisphaerae bacterium WC36]